MTCLSLERVCNSADVEAFVKSLDLSLGRAPSASTLHDCHTVGSVGTYAVKNGKSIVGGFTLMPLSNMGENDLLKGKVKSFNFEQSHLFDMRDFLDGTENSQLLHALINDVGPTDGALYLPAIFAEDCERYDSLYRDYVCDALYEHLKAYMKSGFVRLYAHGRTADGRRLLTGRRLKGTAVLGHDDLYVVDLNEAYLETSLKSKQKREQRREDELKLVGRFKRSFTTLFK